MPIAKTLVVESSSQTFPDTPIQIRLNGTRFLLSPEQAKDLGTAIEIAIAVSEQPQPERAIIPIRFDPTS